MEPPLVRATMLPSIEILFGGERKPLNRNNGSVD